MAGLRWTCLDPLFLEKDVVRPSGVERLGSVSTSCNRRIPPRSPHPPTTVNTRGQAENIHHARPFDALLSSVWQPLRRVNDRTNKSPSLISRRGAAKRERGRALPSPLCRSRSAPGPQSTLRLLARGDGPFITSASPTPRILITHDCVIYSCVYAHILLINTGRAARVPGSGWNPTAPPLHFVKDATPPKYPSLLPHHHYHTQVPGIQSGSSVARKHICIGTCRLRPPPPPPPKGQSKITWGPSRLSVFTSVSVSCFGGAARQGRPLPGLNRKAPMLEPVVVIHFKPVL